jgi:X-Pro dipeptidyl-peptidase (S15 family)/Multicopper oxidase
MDADRVMVELDVPARMRDGVTPRAHVYRPEGDGLWPVLLERTPYGRDQPQLLAWLEPVATARKGFIVGLQDTRGRFGSEGESWRRAHSRPRPRWRGRAQPGLEGHRSRAHGRDGRHPARVTSVGLWMAHCHIAEHHESGMMFSFEVTE